MRGYGSDGAEPTPLHRLSTVAYFMGSSILVQYTTKAIFSSYGFHFPLTVAFLQMLFIAPVSYAIARPELSWQLARGLSPLALVNVLNVVAGLVGTQGLNVPMFIALRRFTLLITILLERFWLHKSHDWPTLAAMSIMIGGALVAAFTDMSFNMRGYAAVLANDLLTSLYLIMVKNNPASHGLSTTGMLFYNSVLSLPLLGGVLLLRSEVWRVLAYPLLLSPQFQTALFLASAMGLTINHSTMVCTRVNEPLMTSVAGNLKNVLMTVVGALAFGDFVFSPWNAAGLGASMAGAVWYATRSAFKARQRALKTSLLSQSGSLAPLLNAALAPGAPGAIPEGDSPPPTSAQAAAAAELGAALGPRDAKRG
ncbi:UDP-glucuronic acid/UDP-N-acetylgalactosamine transporter [Auxenochlorella protothecoides]|uniref:UDP-glucuronic acid/UDP-N-acetylgalactosamine transporter n=1 Tax=Auxenochlorella protothecoides TaxID=3075 RepID=A0A087SF99_AUXPR|nr:UDP-glucuronic acid/UDP-N-acetylgalactosamine transporter [Auxenochlorella protothecoides]KFM24403.1 UDP-glucuronic acid/UDP-N-acetylgalactosamine transporter [Auxenochlorella protothecoides]